ncbi:PEGA domain-containing protein [Sandaracinus amylolyticus]|uniref:PEGA domain-containing protein n=1 Tax=Sandaracinus amylolyticus TaxID=927083 RepID=UPI001F1D2B48|nr:PEGA domain-containing protein [Sandaracinus amylolyticus]
MTRALALVLASIALWPARGAAQERTSLVLPVSIGGAHPADVASIATQIGALPPDQARARYDALASRPTAPTSEALERMVARSRDAVRSLALAEHDAAREALAESLAIAERHVVELGRDPARARQVLDTCLYDVRARLETNDESAEPRARACRVLVPRGEPSPYQHPPEVVELLTRVDAELERAPRGVLRVESEPAGCIVRVQGVELGRTPYASERLAPGEYDVQVECGEARGRVQRVIAAEAAPPLRIDARFEGALHSDDALALAYRDRADADAHRFDDALRLATLLGAREVWLVEARGSTLRIDRIDVAAQRVIASSRAVGARADVAIADLRAGRSRDHRGASATDMAPWDPHPAPPTRPDHTIEHVVGSAIGGLGVAMFVGAWALYGSRVDLGPDLEVSQPTDPDFIPLRDTWLNRRYAVWGLAGAGAALGIAALPFVMIEADGVPWWSWVIAGVGLATSAIGIVEIATADTCPDHADHDRRCVDAAAAVDRGAIVIATSAPLIAVPVVYATRDTSTTVTVEASNERAFVGVRGTF